LILRKIIKIVATRCQILRLKCTKFEGSLQRCPDPLAGFNGPTSNKREGRGKGREGKGVEGNGTGEERKGKGGEGKALAPFSEIVNTPLEVMSLLTVAVQVF